MVTVIDQVYINHISHLHGLIITHVLAIGLAYIP